MREGRYWKEKDKKICMICGEEENRRSICGKNVETWREEGVGNWQEEFGRILGVEREGESWMREIERERTMGGGGARKNG